LNLVYTINALLLYPLHFKWLRNFPKITPELCTDASEVELLISRVRKDPPWPFRFPSSFNELRRDKSPWQAKPLPPYTLTPTLPYLFYPVSPCLTPFLPLPHASMRPCRSPRVTVSRNFPRFTVSPFHPLQPFLPPYTLTPILRYRSFTLI
jgi:hypothetical protein